MVKKIAIRVIVLTLVLVIVGGVIACATTTTPATVPTTPVSSPAETLMPTSTAQPSPTVSIVDSSSHLDFLGYYHVLGEVENNSSDILSYVKVTATFYSVCGTAIGTDSNFSMISRLVPNQKSPFEILETNKAIAAQVDHYALEVSDSRITSESPYREFSILSNSSSRDSIGFYHVVGEVKNTGGQAANYVQIIGTFYDAAGVIVAADFGYTSPYNLAAGQIAPFEIIVLDRTLQANISSYDLQVQSGP